MEILVEIRTVYGNDLIYPCCDKSVALAQLANKKTFAYREIELIKQLGYKISVNQAISTL